MPDFDRETALLVVDLQNDFAHPSGSLSVKGGEDVVRKANEHIQAALRAGALVAYTQDWHPESTPHFEKDGGTWPVHCVADSWGADFHDELLVDGPVVKKGADGRDGYSGFSVRDPQSGETGETQLAAILRERGINKVYVCGLATDYCVVETALDATRLGYETSLLQDTTAGVNLQEGDTERAIERMRDAGVALR